ncbi:MAG: hypothetical protein JXQ87_07240 [Bacteroidia bacterium]
MRRILAGLVLILTFSDLKAQDSLPDTMVVVSGSLNISVNMGRNAGNNTAPENGLVSPGLLVGNVYIGYQYNVGNNWGVNTSLGIGYQPFKFRTVDEASKDVFNEITFMMPYFGLQLGLNRQLDNGMFFGIGIDLHVNTLANYDANYPSISSNIESFEMLYLERSLTEYSAVQQGVNFKLGKQITKGTWSGIDLYFKANLLSRNKLVIDYWFDEKYDEFMLAKNDPDVSIPTPSGKVRYNGGFIGFGVCYNFNQY